jgi:ABC-type dipeptide/oligopeptide/nickel transport system permease subunit
LTDASSKDAPNDEKPGEKYQSDATQTGMYAAQEKPRSRAFGRFFKDPLAVVGFVLVGLLVFAGIIGPMIAPFDPMEDSLRKTFLKPGEQGHWFGTDDLGRDIFSRTLSGARISLGIGVFVSLLSAFIGVAAGSLAGYFLGIWDAVIMRVVDFLLAFPRLILAIAILAVAQNPSLFLVFLVLSVTGWATIARLVRAQVLQAKELEFVQAAQALGASHTRIMFTHILPHISGVIIIWVTLAIPSTIMAEAGLSFLGLGAEPGVPSWGAMINESPRDFNNYWWIPLFPGIALAFSVLGFNLLGDALQDALNPKLEGK